MKKVEFTSFHLGNFGKHEILDSKLGHRVFISGQNKVGKSTVKRALQWVLGTKDENGKEITGIRPHDENGVDIDGLTTVAEIGVSVDGQENTLKRVCFQEKNRQGEYTGKDNLQYFVDDVKKGTKKAYDEFVRGFLPSMVCISAQEFLMKDTAGRREMLSVFSEHDTGSVIDENPEFEPLRAKVKANSVTDLKKACRDKIKAKTKDREAVVVEIRVKEKDKEENIKKLNGLTEEDIQKEKKDIEDKIAENKAKQADISKQFEEIGRQTDGIMELKFELSDLERKANEENNSKKRELDDKITDIQVQIKLASNKALICENNIKSEQNSFEEYKKAIEVEREKYTSNLNMEFNSDELVCPVCKREYDKDKQKELKENFQKTKEETLSKITESGNYFKNMIENCKERIRGYEDAKKEWDNSVAELQKSLKPLVDELEELPDSIDISDREDVKELKQQIAEKEQAMNKTHSVSQIRGYLLAEGETLQSQLNEVNNKLSLAQKNIEIDERISALKKQQMQLSQEIADIERELDLLKQFERKKAELLETDVNKHFELVKFKMFKELQNGELADICSPFVDGTSYDGNLNFSSKILAEIDICLGFQRFYDVQTPILIDNAESINDFRLPQIDNQMIVFRCSDEPQLTIKNLED